MFPVPLTPILGRDEDIGQVLRLLDRDDLRVLTLLGPGGVGKTRLASEVMAEVATEFADGAVFVPLASIRHGGMVPSAIARACAMPDRGGVSSPSVLAGMLRTRHMLLVLDNVEHLLSEDLSWLSDLLESCPRITVLATSRVALNIMGEQRFLVSPLRVPGLGDAPDTANAAANLFEQRARAIDARFAVSRENRGDVSEICRRLEGLPLAIELAAARINILTPIEILDRLSNRFQVLEGGQRDAPPRLRSMRDAITWSYDLLLPAEQQFFRQMTVFVSGFNLDAADAVWEPQLNTDLDTLSGITSLVNASLLQAGPVASGGTRYAMLETIREFGLSLLSARGEAVAARHRHADWCLSLIRQVTPDSEFVDNLAFLDVLELEHANIRVALNWLNDVDRIQDLSLLVRRLRRFWYLGWNETEGLDWYEQLIAKESRLPPAERCDILMWAGQLARTLGTPDGRAYIQQGMALARESGDLAREANAAFFLGIDAEDRGDYSEAESLFAHSEALYIQSGASEQQHLIDVAYHFGVLAYARGRHKEAISALEDARSRARAVGDRMVPDWSLTYLILIAIALDQADRARELLRKHSSASSQNLQHHQPAFLGSAAAAAASLGLFHSAARLFGASAPEGHELPMMLPERLAFEAAAEIARQQLGEDAFRAEWAAGRTMRGEEIKAELTLVADTSAVPEKPGAETPTEAPPSIFTERELEVLRLMADGLSNQQISEALFISMRTVTNHVTHILSKLDAPSRTAAVSWAIRHGIA